MEISIIVAIGWFFYWSLKMVLIFLHKTIEKQQAEAIHYQNAAELAPHLI